MSFRFARPADEALLAELFDHLDTTYFRPHPFGRAGARTVAALHGCDVYLILVEDGRGVAYGMLRGWDEGFTTPSLGIAVRKDRQRNGLGRRMMAELHRIAGQRRARVVRLRVHADNVPARRLYESVGYQYVGTERGELVMELALSPEDFGEDRASG